MKQTDQPSLSIDKQSPLPSQPFLGRSTVAIGVFARRGGRNIAGNYPESVAFRGARETKFRNAGSRQPDLRRFAGLKYARGYCGPLSPAKIAQRRDATALQRHRAGRADAANALISG
jgi:hypothetical protein